MNQKLRTHASLSKPLTPDDVGEIAAFRVGHGAPFQARPAGDPEPRALRPAAKAPLRPLSSMPLSIDSCEFDDLIYKDAAPTRWLTRPEVVELSSDNVIRDGASFRDSANRRDFTSCVQIRKHLDKSAETEWNPFARHVVAEEIEERQALADLEWSQHRKGVRGASRRAIALEACGARCAATNPASGTILRGPDGKPVLGKRSCQARFCRSCTRTRGTKLADDLGAIVDELLRDRSISDGVLRMVTLTAPDPRDGNLALQVTALLTAWRLLRKQHRSELKHCFASLELTYNIDRNSFHPHLHVIVIASDDLDKWGLVGTWQRALGVNINSKAPHVGDVEESRPVYHEDCACKVCERKRGWVDVRCSREGCACHLDGSKVVTVKEAVKYPLKGLGADLRVMTGDRAIEVMTYFRSKRTLERYGRLRSVVSEADDDDDSGASDVRLIDPSTGEVTAASQYLADVLLTDPITGEVFATSSTTARAAGCAKALWSWSGWVVECARELLFSLHFNPVTEEDKDRRLRKKKRQLNRRRARRWQSKQHRIREKTKDWYSADRYANQRLGPVVESPKPTTWNPRAVLTGVGNPTH